MRPIILTHPFHTLSLGLPSLHLAALVTLEILLPESQEVEHSRLGAFHAVLPGDDSSGSAQQDSGWPVRREADSQSQSNRETGLHDVYPRTNQYEQACWGWESVHQKAIYRRRACLEVEHKLRPWDRLHGCRSQGLWAAKVALGTALHDRSKGCHYCCCFQKETLRAMSAHGERV